MRTKAYARITALGGEKVEKIDRMLRQGRPAAGVARMVQKEWGECTDISELSLSKMLTRYRKDIVETTVFEAMEKAGTLDRVTGLVKGMDAVEELTKACSIQKDRLTKMYTQEAKGPLLMKQVSQEMDLFATMLDKLAKLQLETGLLKRAPKVLTGTMQPSDTDPDVLQFRVTEDTIQALEFFENVDYAHAN